MGEIEKLFKKLTVDNRILKNYFLGFNRISSSPTPDRALPEDSVLHCDWSSCWDHSRTLSKQKTNQKLPSASSAFLSTATFLPRQRAAHHQSNRQLIPAQPLSWCLCLPAPCYALIASDWDGVSKQCGGFCLSIVSDTSRSALEVLLQQSRFMIHVRAAAPFSKAAQTWGAQLESWRRSLIWGFPSRSTFIQPGKLSWYCYSSYKSSVVYGASNRNVSQVTYIRKKILMFLGLPTKALPAQYYWSRIWLFARLNNSAFLTKRPRSQEAEPPPLGFDSMMGGVLPGWGGGSAQESIPCWRQLLISF